MYASQQRKTCPSTLYVFIVQTCLCTGTRQVFVDRPTALPLPPTHTLWPKHTVLQLMIYSEIYFSEVKICSCHLHLGKLVTFCRWVLMHAVTIILLVQPSALFSSFCRKASKACTAEGYIEETAMRLCSGNGAQDKGRTAQCQWIQFTQVPT